MARIRQILSLIIIFLAFEAQLLAQDNKYWIVLKDKNLKSEPAISTKTKENRRKLGLKESQWSDLPINNDYLSKLQDNDIKVLQKSKWLNAVSAVIPTHQLDWVVRLGFVKEIIPISKFDLLTIDKPKPTSVNEEDIRVDFAMKQVGIEHFLNAGLSGEGVLIGVIDAGFFGANDSQMLKHLFERNQILGVKDYVNPKKKDYFGERETVSDFHGTEVLNAITGRSFKEKIQVGLATNANFYLARTDSGNREFRREEDNWLAAMEWMDSLGVRLINTSLGYAKGFTNPKESYTPEQMDGKTSVIAKAAKMAVDEKGIILVVSAGNEGDDNSWKIISTPADVDGVIAVGATNEISMKMGYSSIGPEFLSYLKPNVSCFSLFGTSLAAPVITGFVACLLQEQPDLDNRELREILQKSASLYPFGNNFIGYGVPNAKKALNLLAKKSFNDKSPRIVEVNENEKQVEIPVSAGEMVVLFHKKDEAHVLNQESLKAKYNLVSLKRNTSIKQTTVLTAEEVIEIIWKTSTN
ncbi:peptidase S8 and S53 subtilisin kexin sedolisin [Emticicia oligotrophica DSM 17448]|uniref:Peptidase S8 and S53 subtilisin kexin sedolisin n=1 Tax=Emticicia oligotrophica (strain DSM 17448 / CIP 109782 / MTCC 6937 / GPTSA100-15) TaxID=929562 RepID=A0ABM5N6R0_EMTOG|nr:S8 family serine peptidase [Emticicia oligotrophica]AFK05118.1 peptidase S8 and S53 subtilisin kexin sedolisin [Emticicia oligotrophica DSM 17448]